MKVTPRTLPLLAAALIAFTSVASAQFSVLYDFEGNSFAPTIAGSASDINASNLLGHGSFNTSYGFRTFDTSTVLYQRADYTAADYTAALTESTYFNFTLTANTDINLEDYSLSFDMGIDLGTSAGPYVANVIVAYSIDGGTTEELGIYTYDAVTNGVGIDPYTISLSGITVDNGSTIDFSFRVYENASSSFAYRKYTIFDNIEISSVPEPSTVAMLLGLTALGFAALKRRKA